MGTTDVEESAEHGFPKLAAQLKLQSSIWSSETLCCIFSSYSLTCDVVQVM